MPSSSGMRERISDAFLFTGNLAWWCATTRSDPVVVAMRYTVRVRTCLLRSLAEWGGQSCPVRDRLGERFEERQVLQEVLSSCWQTP